MGTLLVMKPWSISMRTRPTIVSVPPLPKRRTMGTASSRTVPACPMRTAVRDGVRSRGKSRYMSRRIHAKRVTGLFDVITPTTDGKW